MDPLQETVGALRRGEVIAYPTEGVWGLGCDPDNRAAVERLLALKQRDWRKGLILIASHYRALEKYVEPPSEAACEAAFASWPGPATWIFPASAHCPKWLSGGRDTIAVRVTAHSGAAALCKAWGGALVSTSANRSGQPPAMSIEAVRAQFPNQLGAVLPGPLGGQAGPTPIRDLLTGELLRSPV